MSKDWFPLDNVKVAAPCAADWRFMYGDDRVRFCGQCSQYVYNLSALTREQAEDLIRRQEGRLCVRFYRRRDGTIITDNCPVGLRALKAKYNSTKATILKAVMAFLAYLGVLWWAERAHAVKPVVMGAFAIPDPFPGVPTVTRSEQFIRERAIYQVMPATYADGGKPLKGDAVVKVVILPTGAVERAHLINGPESLRGDIEGAARKWTFQPMTEGGQPVRVESTLTFRLGSLLPRVVARPPAVDKKACGECL